MTPYQIGALCLFAAIVAWTYLPAFSFKIPTPPGKPSVLKQIEQVLAIKDSSSDPLVKEACQHLLQVLIS